MRSASVGALDQLEDQRAGADPAGVFLDTVDGRDVRMIERSENCGLPFEPRKAIAVIGECARAAP